MLLFAANNDVATNTFFGYPYFIFNNHSIPMVLQDTEQLELQIRIQRNLNDLFLRYKLPTLNERSGGNTSIQKKGNLGIVRHKRSMPEIHMRKKDVTKLRTCNDMKGILGINFIFISECSHFII